MPQRSKHVLATLVAALAMAMAVSAASANRLTGDDADFKIVWSPIEFAAVGLSTITCDLTISGRFHRALITKAIDALVGSITHASIEQPSCEGGSGTVLSNTLPWHIVYKGFSGALPEIEGVQLSVLNASFSVATELATCLARTTEAEPATGIGNAGGGGAISSVTAEEGNIIDVNDTTGIFCDFFGVNGTFSGTGAAEDQSGNPIVIRLI